MPSTSQSHIRDQLGLVAGMVDALGMGAISAHALPQDLTTRPLARGQAVKAMGRNGRGVVHPPRARVPSCFPHKPTERLVGPGMPAAQLPEAVRGRALDTRDPSGGTAR